MIAQQPPRRIDHGRRHTQERAKVRAFPRRAPGRHGTAEDALSRLRGEDAAVRQADRRGHRANALRARRDPARPRATPKKNPAGGGPPPPPWGKGWGGGGGGGLSPPPPPPRGGGGGGGGAP